MCEVEQNKKLAALFLDLYRLKKRITTTHELQEKPLRYPSVIPSLIGYNHANTNALKIGTDSRRKTQLRT